jgi:predicted enzyme related to lactoylglutathione lyase
MPPEPTTPALTLLVLKTRDPAAALLFYHAVGITFTEERHGTGPLHHAGRAGGTLLEIYPLADAGPADANTRLGFAVPDLDATLAALGAVGASVEQPVRATPWGRRAVVRDPDERAVELYGSARP